jgi:hypothetical protein
VLCKHASKQFYRDGFTVEQAVAYHFFTLGFLSLYVVFSRRMKSADPKLEAIVKRAFIAGRQFERLERLRMGL